MTTIFKLSANVATYQKKYNKRGWRFIRNHMSQVEKKASDISFNYHTPPKPKVDEKKELKKEIEKNPLVRKRKPRESRFLEEIKKPKIIESRPPEVDKPKVIESQPLVNKSKVRESQPLVVDNPKPKQVVEFEGCDQDDIDYWRDVILFQEIAYKREIWSLSYSRDYEELRLSLVPLMTEAEHKWMQEHRKPAHWKGFKLLSMAQLRK